MLSQKTQAGLNARKKSFALNYSPDQSRDEQGRFSGEGIKDISAPHGLSNITATSATFKGEHSKLFSIVHRIQSQGFNVKAKMVAMGEWFITASKKKK